MGKASYPTPRGAAANRAKQKYNKEHYSRISLNVSKEYHYYLKLKAKADGQSLNAWILQAIEERADEEDGKDISRELHNMIEWMRKQKISDHDILDCIQFVFKEEEDK